jgi:hypothetical protein
MPRASLRSVLMVVLWAGAAAAQPVRAGGEDPTAEALQPGSVLFSLEASLLVPIEGAVQVRPFLLGLAWQPASHFALGVRSVGIGGGYSSIEGAILALSGTPFVEVNGFVAPVAQLFGQIGVAVGYGWREQGQDTLDVAVSPRVGARWWTTPSFAIVTEAGADIALTRDGLLLAEPGDLAVFAGVAFHWRF